MTGWKAFIPKPALITTRDSMTKICTECGRKCGDKKKKITYYICKECLIEID